MFYKGSAEIHIRRKETAIANTPADSYNNGRNTEWHSSGMLQYIAQTYTNEQTRRSGVLLTYNIQC